GGPLLAAILPLAPRLLPAVPPANPKGSAWFVRLGPACRGVEPRLAGGPVSPVHSDWHGADSLPRNGHVLARRARWGNARTLRRASGRFRPFDVSAPRVHVCVVSGTMVSACVARRDRLLAATMAPTAGGDRVAGCVASGCQHLAREGLHRPYCAASGAEAGTQCVETPRLDPDGSGGFDFCRLVGGGK